MSGPRNRLQGHRAKQAATPQPMGTTYQRLEQPEPVADLSVTQVTEIKGRAAEIDWLRDQAQHFSRAHVTAQDGHRFYLREICRELGIDLEAGVYEFDLEAGRIVQTGRLVPAQDLQVIEGSPSGGNGHIDPENVEIGEKPEE